MKKYILTEKQLKELLISQYALEALEAFGVDNWDWYFEAFRNDMLERNYDPAKWTYPDMIENLLKKDLKNYLTKEDK